MRTISYLLLAVFGVQLSVGQMQTPQPSPFSTIEQMVGLTQVKVEYSRPSMRGRAVFGNLIPFDALWRTGANQNTMITFSDAVTIGTSQLKAGTYAIFTKPAQDQWEVFFYTDTNNWGTPSNWDESKIAATLQVPVYKMEMPVETFTITIDDLTNNGASIGIIWENTYVGIPFEVPTKDKAMKSIETTLQGPSARDYYSAASYYFEEGADLNKAMMWINKAVELDKEGSMYWVLRKQSLIHAAAGNKKTAIEAAKKSLAAAEKAGNQDYIKMNKDSLAEWGAK